MISNSSVDLPELQGLSEQEREIALKILGDMSDNGKSKDYDDILYADYEEIPVDIETFLHDKRYLGNALITAEGKFTVFPYWVETLKKIFPNNIDTAYNTLILTGGIGLGKSFVADICIAYLLHRMLCLRDPYMHYGLQPIDKITFSFINVTIDAAKGVAWDKIQQLLQSSSWFMAHGTISGRSEVVWTPSKRIELVMGSSNNVVIGRAVFCLDGDTVIKTSLGDSKISDLAGKSINVVSLDNNGNEILSDTCTVEPTIVTDEEYQVELEDGSVIKCTGDHLFMLADGTYKAAKDLTEYDELMDKPRDAYDQFISKIIEDRGQWSIEGEYFEGHHIIPRCLGGKGDTKKKHPNIIRLYPAEHYEAHRLLIEKYPDIKQLKFAFYMMNIQNTNKHEIPSEEYAKAKKWISDSYRDRVVSEETRKKMSIKAKRRSSSISAMRKGKVAITNGTECRYITRDDVIPDGWFYGTNSVGHHPKHTVHKKHVIKNIEAFKKQKSDQCSGTGNNMYGKGYKIAGGNNGRAKTRYFFQGAVFECRKELVEYIIKIGLKATDSVIRTIESGQYGDIFKHRYQFIIDNLRWEDKDAD